MTVAFWATPGEDVSRWDQLYLGDRVWPGIWSVEISKSRDVDKAKANTKDGYTLANKGYAGAPVTASGRLWTQEQLDELESFISIYDPEYSRISEPLDMYHPTFEILLLSQVLIKKLNFKPPAPGAKYATLTIDLDQWFPAAKVKKSKPIGFDGTSLAGGKINPADFRVGPPKI